MAVISFLTYTAALERFESLRRSESLVELFGITGNKPPKLLDSSEGFRKLERHFKAPVHHQPTRLDELTT